MQKCEVLAIGTELLMGQISNTNAQYISRRLPEAGVGVYFHSVIGDNADRIKTSLKLALSRADIVIVTGGLGPTKDDITKETIAEYLNLPMVLDEPTLIKIKTFFSKINKTMVLSNEKQAYFPKGSIIIQNANGTAPGFIIETGSNTIIILPGPPFEMIPMFDDFVMQYIMAKNELHIYSEYIKVFGLGESSMENIIIDLIDDQSNPTIAPYVNYGEITLRVTACAETKDEAVKLMLPIKEELQKRLGDYIFNNGTETLAEVTSKLLIDKGMTIATAESCTGGMIAAKLTDFPGISKVFKMSTVVYSNEAKVSLLGVSNDTLNAYGAVSAETAREMAIGIIKLSCADLGIAVTGIAGPDGGTEEKPVGLVYIALAGKDLDSVTCEKFFFTGSREQIRNKAVANAFDMIRRKLNA